MDLVKQIGTDAQVVDLAPDVLLVSAHLSNNQTEFKAQIEALKALISQSGKHAIVIGDFNAQCLLEDQTLYFYKKDLETADDVRAAHNKIKIDPSAGAKLSYGQLSFDRPIILGTPSAPTTNKIRLMTTQLEKILKHAVGTIDWCFVVPKSGSTANVNVQTKLGLNPTSGDGLMPASWCTDHFMIDANVKIDDRTYRIGSLNILGASVGKVAHNYFEMLDEDAKQYVYTMARNEDILNRRDELVMKFVRAFKDENHPDKDILELMRTTKDGRLEDKDLTEKKVSSLMNIKETSFMNIHAPHFAKDEVKAAFRESVNEFLGGLAPTTGGSDAPLAYVSRALDELRGKELDAAGKKKLVGLYVSKNILEFYEGLYNAHESMFASWYERINNKPTNCASVIKDYLDNDFDAFALQEVNKDFMLPELLQPKKYAGYKVHNNINDPSKVTTGAIIVKEGAAEPPVTTATAGAAAVAVSPAVDPARRQRMRFIIGLLVILVVIVIVVIVVATTSTFRDYVDAHSWL